MFDSGRPVPWSCYAMHQCFKRTLRPKSGGGAYKMACQLLMFWYVLPAFVCVHETHANTIERTAAEGRRSTITSGHGPRTGEADADEEGKGEEGKEGPWILPH